MERLREELCKVIEQYGINDLRTIQKSQELDILVNKDMKLNSGKFIP